MMRLLITVGVFALCGLTPSGHALAGDDALLEDLFGPYRQRRDSVTPGAGNANDANAAVHIINPWPRAARFRNIPGEGRRSGDAMRRYQRRAVLPAADEMAKPPTAPTGVSPGGLGADGSESGSAPH